MGLSWRAAAPQTPRDPRGSAPWTPRDAGCTGTVRGYFDYKQTNDGPRVF